MGESPEIISPFQRKYANDESEFNTSQTINIRLNDRERAMLDTGKRLLNTSQDGAALKRLASIGLNVLQATLGEQNSAWMTSHSRVKQRKT